MKFEMKIGILSGYGSAAGARFFSDLIKECQRLGAKADSDFPEVVLYNYPTHGLDKKGIADERRVKSELAHAIKMLNNNGVQRIAIVCNSIFVYYDYLQKMSKAKIVNMPEVVQKMCQYQQVGLLSSRTTRDSGVYKGITFFTSEEEQDTVDSVIESVITGAPTRVDRIELRSIIDRMFQKGAMKVILGCTELPLAVRRSDRIIDAGYETIKHILT